MLLNKFCCGFLAFTLLLAAPLSWAVDIQISTTDVEARYTPGLTVINSYDVVIEKATSTGTVTDIGVSIGFIGETDGISSMTWTCSAPGASTCSSAGATTSSDNIALTVDLAGNNDVTVTFTSVTYNSTNTNDLDFDVAITDPGMIGTSANVDSTASNDTDSDTVVIRDETDITITVSDGVAQDEYIPGTTAQYTIAVSNAGPNSANNVEITDLALPSGLSISGWTCTAPGAGNSCSSNSGGSTLDTDLDLVSGGSASIIVNGNYAANAQTSPLVYQVQARITDNTEYDPDGLIQAASDSNVRAPQADLVIAVDTQPAGGTEYTPGSTEVFTVLVTNDGPSDVTGITVVDNNLSAFSAISWTCTADTGSACASGSGPGRLNTTVDLDAGDSATFVVSVTYDSATTASSLTYTVTATNASGVDGDSPVSNSTSPLLLQLESDLTVSLSDSSANYTPGVSATYTALITNDGPSDAVNISVVDNALSEFATISWSCAASTGSQCDDASGNTDIDSTVDLEAGDTATFTINVTYDSAAFTNPLVYQIEASTLPAVTSNSPVNNSDSDSLARQVDLSITKTTPNVTTLVPNQPFFYRIVVSNDGPSDLGAAVNVNGQSIEDGVLLTDIIDTTLLDHPSQCNAGDGNPCWRFCSGDGGEVLDISPDSCPANEEISEDSGDSISLPVRLSAGSSSEIFVYARVNQSTGSNCDAATVADNELCNTASIALQDNNSTNTGSAADLTDSVSNEIVIGTDLLISKSDGVQAAAPGSTLTYDIVVRNDGFTEVIGASVSDVLPLFPTETAGFVPGTISFTCETDDVNACCVSSSTACGLTSPVTYSPNDVLNASIDLAGQTEVTFKVTGTLSTDASGTVVNSATVTVPAGVVETNINNNTATDNDTSLGAVTDVSVEKTLGPVTVNQNDDSVLDFVYEIVVSNAGPSFANNVNVDDPLNDSNLDLTTASWTCTAMGGAVCDEVGPITQAPLDTTVDLPVGGQVTFVVNISTNPSPQGTVLNVVNVLTSGGGVDPIMINNIDSVEYPLSGAAQLRISNDDTLLTATPGEAISYTVQIQNEGPDNVFGAQVENIFPAQLSDVTWTCDAVSPIPGDLTLFNNSAQTTAGSRMIISGNDGDINKAGAHIYVGTSSGSLFVYQRNTTPGINYGEFQLLEQLVDGSGGVSGIESIISFVMSANGAQLYVLSAEPSSGNAAIAIFNRVNNRLLSSYGQLSFSSVVNTNMPINAVDMLMTADQKHIYISGDDNINRFSRNTGTGFLTFDESLAATDAGHMVASLDNKSLVVVDETGSDITSYTRVSLEADPDFGDLTLNNTLNNADLAGNSDVVISPDQRQVYIAAEGTGHLLVFGRDLTTGEISALTSYDDSSLSFNQTETLIGLKHLTLSPDGQHLFVSNPIANSLLVLSRNSQGFLSKNQRISENGLEGVIDSVVTPDGRQVLTTASLFNGKTLTAFDRRQPDPIFAFVEVEKDGINAFVEPAFGLTTEGLRGASSVVVSPDGNHVYATGLSEQAIAVFTRDRTKGSTVDTRGEHLSFLTVYREGVNGVSGLVDVNSSVITPNGDFLIVGSTDTNTLTVFTRHADGTLDFVDKYVDNNAISDGLLGITGLVVDDSSQHLYVGGQFEASVAHYSIAANGQLTLIDSVANGDTGVSGLNGVRALSLTDDQKHLVVASGVDDSVVVLTRNVTNGRITFLQSLFNVGNQPMDLVVAPDDGHIYVASANDSRLTVLQRVTNGNSPQFGKVSIQTSYVDEVGGFNEFHGLRSLAISPDGKKVYAGAEYDSAVTVLDRDNNPNSGTYGLLSIIEVQKDNVDGVDGLDLLYDIAVSRDGRHVYAAGFGDDAVAAFVLGVGSTCSSQGSGNILDSVDVGSNGTLTYSIQAMIRSNAVGVLTTEARLTPPGNFTAISPIDTCVNASLSGNDICDQDTTTLTPKYDLAITKTNGKLTAVAGEPVVYDVVVTNAGPSDAASNDIQRIMVKDKLLADFESNSVNWTCNAVGSGALSFVGAAINGVDNVAGLSGVSSLAFANDLAGLGQHVIATSVLDNGLLVFELNPLNGQLTQVLQNGNYIEASPSVRIRGARDVLVINNDIYVASQVDDSLVAFKASDNSGLTISLIDNFDYSAGVLGLNQAVSISASNNGTHLYVTGANDNAVVIFERNIVSGELSNPITLDVSVNGIFGVNQVAVSADGYSVYVAGANNNTLGIYQRDPMTGSLNFVGILTNPGLVFSSISAITISPDDQQVYVTSQANNRIYVLARDTSVPTSSNAYGALSLIQTIEQGASGVNGLLKPSDIKISADRRHVYVSSEQSDSVVWFARNDETGMLVFSGFVSDLIASIDGLDGASALAVDGNGRYVFVAGSQDHAVAVLTRSADSFCPSSGTGNLVEMFEGQEAGIPVDLAVNGQLTFKIYAQVATSATVEVSNTASVYSCGLPLSGPVESCTGGLDPLLQNNTDDDVDAIEPIADLMITKTDGISQYDGLAGASQVTGNNRFVFVAAAQDNAISIFRRQDNSGDGVYGDLTYLDRVRNGEDGVSGLLGVSDVLLSANSKYLYAAGSGDNSIVVFALNQQTGELTFIEKLSSGVFGVTGIEGVSAMALSTDGAHLYATGTLTNSLAVFAVDQSLTQDQGRLYFKQSLQNAVGGVSGLAAVSDVLVSNDDKHVYVTSETGNSLAMFLRNPNSGSLGFGQLSFQTLVANGQNGVAGIAGAKALQASEDGLFLYVLGGVDQALAVFAREPMDGSLSFVEFKQNGTSSVVGLNLANDLWISSDQKSIYVAGRGENRLIRFDRNDIDGTLIFAESLVDGESLGVVGSNINGLAAASGVFISPDDEHIYVASLGDGAVSIFNRDASSPTPQLGSMTFQGVLVNGQGGVSPGSEITYFITASNAGPSDALNVRVRDVFPSVFDTVSYQCFPLNGAGCDPAIKTGNVNEVVNLPVGSSVEIRATGTLRPDASGVVSNTATVNSSTNPTFAVTDLNQSNNSATDDDTVLLLATDISVNKDNMVAISVPGDSVSYSIRVSNQATQNGNAVPPDVMGVLVTDVVPESISDVSWTCEAFPQPGLLDDGDANGLTSEFLFYNELTTFKDMTINVAGEVAYVVGEGFSDSTLLVYDRETRSGALDLLQEIHANDAGISGLSGANALALSPNGRQLYVVSDVDDALVTFDVNLSTGELSIAGVLTDGIQGVNGLGGASDVLVSPDGLHVYVAGKSDQAIAIFNRNLSSGSLVYNDLLSNVEGLNGVNAMVFKGSLLLAVAETNDSLASFSRSTVNGLLTPADVIQDFELAGSVLDGPQDLIVINNQVMVVSQNSNALSIFEVNTSDGLLSYKQVLRQGDPGINELLSPQAIVASPQGGQVYVASFGSEAIMMFDNTGEAVEVINASYNTTLIPEFDQLNGLYINNSGSHIYALSDDLVSTKRLNGSRCSNEGVGNLSELVDVASNGYVEYTLSGTILATATGQLSNTAVALLSNADTELNPIDNTSTDSDSLLPTSDLSVSKDDLRSEVVAGTSLTYELDVFSAGPSAMSVVLEDALPLFPAENAGFFAGTVGWFCSTGRTLQLNEIYQADLINGLADTTAVVQSNDNKHVYVISAEGTISVFSKDTSGQLTFVQLISEGDTSNQTVLVGLTGASALAINHSDTHVYIISQAANKLFVFERDLITGQLDLVEVEASGANNVVGMQGPVAIHISPDETGVYLAAKDSDAITVFLRDPLTGELTFVERVRDGFGTIVPESNVILEITDLASSPDGEFVYAVAEFSEAISVFRRNPSTQVLTFVQVIRGGDNINGQLIPELAGVSALTLSLNGNYVYTLASDSQSIVWFERNSSTGRLSYLDHFTEGDSDIGPMLEPTHLALTPDGGRLLILDALGEAISIYERNVSSGQLTLVDVFDLTEFNSFMPGQPSSLSTDGTNIYTGLVNSESLLALRVVANAECLLEAGQSNVVSVPMYMTPGSAAQVDVEAVVHPSARGVISNMASVILNVDSADPNLMNNQGIDNDTMIRISTDVEIIKTGPETAVAGESIVYELVLSNTGPSDALEVRVNDSFDAALEDITWTCQATGRSSCSNATGTGDLSELVDVSEDGVISFEITASIDSSFYGSLINEASAVVFEEGQNTDVNLNNNTSQVSTEVIRVADMMVTKSNATSEVVAGEFTSYEIIVSNAGPSDGEALVTDVMPAILNQVTWTCSSGVDSSCTPSGSGSINDSVYVAADDQIVYFINAQVASSAVGTIINSVNIVPINNVTDPDLMNNSDSDTDDITQVSDLSLELFDLLDPYDPASPVDLPYYLKVTNLGPSDAQNVHVELPLQLDVTVENVNVCAINNNVINCEIGESLAGEVHDFTIDYRLNPALTGDITNLAEVLSSTFDPVEINNTASTITTLISGVDIRVSQGNGRTEIEPGETTTYIINVDNIGSVDAGEVQINEQLPAGLLSASWQCEAFDNASCINFNEMGLTGSVDLPSGGRVRITLTATVDPALQDMSQMVISNQVEAVLITETDFNLLNNISIDTDVLIYFIFKNGFEEVLP